MAAVCLSIRFTTKDPESDTFFLLSLFARWQKIGGDKSKRYPTGYIHIDIAEVRKEVGKLHLFVAIDGTSKFTYVELREKVG